MQTPPAGSKIKENLFCLAWRSSTALATAKAGCRNLFTSQRFLFSHGAWEKGVWQTAVYSTTTAVASAVLQPAFVPRVSKIPAYWLAD